MHLENTYRRTKTLQNRLILNIKQKNYYSKTNSQSKIIMKTKLGIKIIYCIGLLLGIFALVFSYTGLPTNYDTEPILGFGLILISVAGLLSLKN